MPFEGVPRVNIFSVASNNLAFTHSPARLLSIAIALRCVSPSLKSVVLEGRRHHTRMQTLAPAATTDSVCGMCAGYALSEVLRKIMTACLSVKAHSES